MSLLILLVESLGFASSASKCQVTSLRDLDCTFCQRLSLDYYNENPIYKFVTWQSWIKEFALRPLNIKLSS